MTDLFNIAELGAAFGAGAIIVGVLQRLALRAAYEINKVKVWRLKRTSWAEAAVPAYMCPGQHRMGWLVELGIRKRRVRIDRRQIESGAEAADMRAELMRLKAVKVIAKQPVPVEIVEVSGAVEVAAGAGVIEGEIAEVVASIELAPAPDAVASEAGTEADGDAPEVAVERKAARRSWFGRRRRTSTAPEAVVATKGDDDAVAAPVSARKARRAAKAEAKAAQAAARVEPDADEIPSAEAVQPQATGEVSGVAAAPEISTVAQAATALPPEIVVVPDGVAEEPAAEPPLPRAMARAKGIGSAKGVDVAKLAEVGDEDLLAWINHLGDPATADAGTPAPAATTVDATPQPPADGPYDPGERFVGRVFMPVDIAAIYYNDDCQTEALQLIAPDRPDWEIGNDAYRPGFEVADELAAKRVAVHQDLTAMRAHAAQLLATVEWPPVGEPPLPVPPGMGPETDSTTGPSPDDEAGSAARRSSDQRRTGTKKPRKVVAR